MHVEWAQMVGHFEVFWGRGGGGGEHDEKVLNFQAYHFRLTTGAHSFCTKRLKTKTEHYTMQIFDYTKF